MFVNGSFAKFEAVDKLRQKLDNHSYEHDLEGNLVQALIQLQPSNNHVDDTSVISGIAIDYKMLPVTSLMEEGGRFYPNTTHEPKQVWADFQIIGNELIMTSTMAGREIALPILSHAIGGTTNHIIELNFDLEKIFKDYSGHWLGSIYDRDGHMQRGTFYGESIEKDDVIGKCWKGNKKLVVGFLTDYFGNGSTKVKVTRDGSVFVYGDISAKDYLRFVLVELKPYMIDAPRSRRRHTS